VSAERWERLKEVFGAALDRAPEERDAFLDAACGGDPDLRAEVTSLLASHDRAGGFIEAAPLLGRLAAEISEEVEDEAVGRRIGPYRLLGVIGRGGMSTVYRAVRDDDDFQKQVAVKLVRGGLASDHLVRRFREERQILARLEHPNIATLHDGGTTAGGQPYFVMELIDGRPVDAYCEDRALSTRERLALFRTICSAVQYAHQHLVVHRDLKPANIVVTAEGVPKLLDFGIAKLLSENEDPASAPTATVLPLLTPEYASPEQVQGRPVTTASDVYSLGVILYQLLAGRRPYELGGRSPEELLRAVSDTQPKRPSAVATGSYATSAELSGDLDTIVLKALRKEPARRYASAQELAEDIRRYLEDLPVLARGDSLRYRAGKLVRRHKAAVAAAALAMVGLVTGTVVALHQARVADLNMCLGQAHAALAVSRRTAARARVAHWREARSRLRKGYESWLDLKNRGNDVPSVRAKLETLTRELARCDAALAGQPAR
jgi:serine/threonine protein kinase